MKKNDVLQYTREYKKMLIIRTREVQGVEKLDVAFMYIDEKGKPILGPEFSIETKTMKRWIDMGSIVLIESGGQ